MTEVEKVAMYSAFRDELQKIAIYGGLSFIEKTAVLSMAAKALGGASKILPAVKGAGPKLRLPKVPADSGGLSALKAQQTGLKLPQHKPAGAMMGGISPKTTKMSPALTRNAMM